jgi:hypothetical protein
MVLDPHHAFVDHPGGISINIVEEGGTYKDQLAPFMSIIPSKTVPFSGTAFRLPLRTSDQATRSKISDKATHVAELREILHGFVSNELESVILFLKHITSIEVRRIDPLGKESILGKVEIDRLDMTHNSGQAHRTITLTLEDGDYTTRTRFFYLKKTKPRGLYLPDWNTTSETALRMRNSLQELISQSHSRARTSKVAYSHCYRFLSTFRVLRFI